MQQISSDWIMESRPWWLWKQSNSRTIAQFVNGLDLTHRSGTQASESLTCKSQRPLWLCLWKQWLGNLNQSAKPDFCYDYLGAWLLYSTDYLISKGDPLAAGRWLWDRIRMDAAVGYNHYSFRPHHLISEYKCTISWHCWGGTKDRSSRAWLSVS